MCVYEYLIPRRAREALVAPQDAEVRDLEAQEDVRVEHGGAHEAADHHAPPDGVIHLDFLPAPCHGPHGHPARDRDLSMYECMYDC